MYKDGSGKGWVHFKSQSQAGKLKTWFRCKNQGAQYYKYSMLRKID